MRTRNKDIVRRIKKPWAETSPTRGTKGPTRAPVNKAQLRRWYLTALHQRPSPEPHSSTHASRQRFDDDFSFVLERCIAFLGYDAVILDVYHVFSHYTSRKGKSKRWERGMRLRSLFSVRREKMYESGTDGKKTEVGRGAKPRTSQDSHCESFQRLRLK